MSESNVGEEVGDILPKVVRESERILIKRIKNVTVSTKLWNNAENWCGGGYSGSVSRLLINKIHQLFFNLYKL